MKKHNSFKAIKFAVGAALLALSASFFSCKSTPDLALVDAFELLDGDAALYLTIPVQANQEFVTLAVQKVSGASESDSKKIAERLDMAYVAIGTNGEMQLSVSGKIPTTMASFALTEKKGWKASALEQQVCYTHSHTLYQLCLPSSSNAFLSHNIEPMIKRYNKIAYAGFSDEILAKNKKLDSDSILSSKNSDVKILSENLKELDYKFLHENLKSDIMLYSPNPRIFIRNFLGAVDVNTSISSIYANIRPYKEVKGYDYNVRLVLNLSDARTVKATEALLKVGLFGMAAKISQTGQSQITIVDLLLTKNQILSLIK